MSEAQPYVQCDEQGVMRVRHTRVMLDSIVAGFEQGHSPETIQQQYPEVSKNASQRAFFVPVIWTS